jgi:DNA-binding winged helix-turn-helix (wHTH) protein/tetratricopeptide (TPR) repeat protein
MRSSGQRARRTSTAAHPADPLRGPEARPELFSFEDYQVDERTYELRRAGTAIPLEPKAFDVLLYLIRNRDRVVSKRELLEKIWSDVTVTESVLTTTLTTVRKALGSRGDRNSLVRTVYGRGYHFVSPVEVVSANSADAAAHDPLGAFVGREDLLAELHATFDAVLQEQTRAVILTGEPGIGKTRVAERFLERTQARGAWAGIARCRAEGAPPFWPWVQLLRRLGVDRGEETPLSYSEIVETPPASRLRPTGPALPPNHARFRLFQGVAEFLVTESQARPLVLLFDDLQWADAPSLGLLDFLLYELRNAPVLVLATVRSEVTDHAEILSTIMAKPQARCIAVQGFSPRESQEFLRTWLRREPLTGWVSELHRRTGGNPLFLREMAQTVLPEGRAERAFSIPLRSAIQSASRRLPRWLPEGAPTAMVGVPETVRGLVAQRLRCLSEQANRVLAAAATLGDTFDLRILARMTDLSPSGLLPILQEARAAHLIGAETDASGRERFAHAIVREGLYEALPRNEQQSLHRRAGEALERLYEGQLEPALPELAYHFHAALTLGVSEKALVYAVQAARRAMDILAFEEAARHYGRAVQAVELHAPTDGKRRAELLLGLGDAHQASGGVDASRRAYLAAAQAARDADDAALFARASLSFGFGMWAGAGADEPVRMLLKEALRRIGDADPTLRASLLAHLTVIGPAEDSTERIDEITRGTLAAARASRCAETLSEALMARHFALQGPDHLEERIALAEEISQLTENLGRVHRSFGVLEAKAADLLVSGDVNGFERTLERSAFALRESRHPWFPCLKTLTDASIALLRGRFDEGERRMQESLTIAQRVQYPYASEMFLGQSFVLLRGRGRMCELGAAIPDVVEKRGWIPFVRLLPLIVAVECDRLDEVKDAFERIASNNFASIPKRDDWLTCMVELAVVAHGLEDAARAKILYEMLEPYAALHAAVRGVLLYAGPVQRALALLAATLGWRSESARHFDAALEGCTRVGAVPMTARIRFEYGQSLLRAGGTSAQLQGKCLTRLARETADELGMVDLARRCEAPLETPRAGLILRTRGHRARPDEHGVLHG